MAGSLRQAHRRACRGFQQAEEQGPGGADGTLELAHCTGLAAGGVSAQLHRLAAAGLVAPHRTGRVVLYARTSRGEALYR